MAFLEDLIADIADAEVDFKSPASEDLMTRFRDNVVLVLAALAGDSSKLLQGAIDSTPASSTITDTNPTAGTLDRDDKFNGLYIHFTSGTIFSNNSRNRFKITDCDSGASTITVAENLNSLGATIGDTYEILGHTHDGDSSDADGRAIDGTSLTNVAEDTDVTQDEWDAFTDPDSNRGSAATKGNPFATLNDISSFPTDGIILWETSGTCPAGFTKISTFNGKALLGGSTPGTNSGADTKNFILDASGTVPNVGATTATVAAASGAVLTSYTGGSSGAVTRRTPNITSADVVQASRTIVLCKKT